MTPALRRLFTSVAGVMLLSVTCVPSHAQSAGSGCPPQSEIERNDQITIGRTWLPMRIGIDLALATCRAHDFLVNLFKRQPDADKATLDDIAEASKPDVERGSDPAFQARLRATPSPSAQPGWNRNPATSIVVLPPPTPGGTPVLFQPNAPGGVPPASLGQVEGNGTLLSTNGIKRGTFVGGKLSGQGEEIDPDGTWRSGTYDRGTNVGSVFEVRNVAGKTYLAVGSVVDGKLDGMIERVFADGSTQFEDWENGKLMQVGNRAPKGQTALAPKTRLKTVEVAESEDAYKHIGPRAKIAPGTTFDPARTTQTGFDGRWENTTPVLPPGSGGGGWPSNVVREITISTRPEGLFVTTVPDGYGGLFVLDHTFEGGKKYRLEKTLPGTGQVVQYGMEAYDGFNSFRFQDGSYGANFRRWRTPAQHATDRARAEKIWQACEGKARTYASLNTNYEPSIQTQISEQHADMLSVYDRSASQSEIDRSIEGYQKNYEYWRKIYDIDPKSNSIAQYFLSADLWYCFAQKERDMKN